MTEESTEAAAEAVPTMATVSDSEDSDGESSLDDYYSDTPLEADPSYPSLCTSFESVVILTNLPKAPRAKLEKLTKVVTKLVTKIGALAEHDGDDGTPFSGVSVPFDDAAGQTHGFALVEFASVAVARQALEVLEGYRFDKHHLLGCHPYERALGLRKVDSENFTSEPPPPFKETADTSSWLLDEAQRDQFVIREGKETAVYWSDGKATPVVDYDGAREKAAGVSWCEYYVNWSPKGTYLATLVPSKGVILWGGKGFQKVGRFPSSGVQFVSFSPLENYILTNNGDPEDSHAVKIFSIQTGKLHRAFPLYPKDMANFDANDDMPRPPPPPFEWSYDDSYIARMGKDLISVYDTATMKLNDRRSLIANGIKEFRWCPTANILSYWAPEVGNSPAHVDLIAIPSRKKLRQKNLFHVTKCGLVWHPDGTYLGVKVTRHTKSKKTMYNNIELFRVKDENIPIEMLEIKDAVMAFAWEPKGDRFAMIHAENPEAAKVKVSIYSMIKTDKVTITNKTSKKKQEVEKHVKEVTLVETMIGKQCNCVFWSPVGGVVLLAGLGDTASGTLEFYDLAAKTLAIKEHYRANEVLWDPSGRTVVTTVSQPIQGGHFKFAMDNGYVLWSFQGKQLHQTSYETFYQFSWRPREILLDESAVAEVRANLKKYERDFDKADRVRTRTLYLEETKGKRDLRSLFRQRMARLLGFYDQQKEARMDLLDGYDSDDEANYVSKSIMIETVISETSKTISSN